MYTALETGREKNNNILIHGPADCGKTFILSPICDLLPEVFLNPANSTFGWLGVENANLIFLNDLRWAPRSKGGNIDWAPFLNLLEGQTVTLPAPMNSCAEHIKVVQRMPIFATSVSEVRYWENNVNEPVTPTHNDENAMMRCRWNCFRFTYQISEEDKVKVANCTACFAKFVLNS